MFDDGIRTPTTKTQHDLEVKLLPFHERFQAAPPEEWAELLTLRRAAHVTYLHQHLAKLPAPFIALDASRTWMVYWIVHSLSLLNAPLPSSPTTSEIIAFLGECQDPDGGFGGGPGQLPHLAATYAAVMSLIILGTPDAYEIIDKSKLKDYLLRMCQSPDQGGGMFVHENGEVDVRGCYTAMAIAHILNLDKQKIAEKCAMAQFLCRCQTHEGGFGGEPGNEAHGGYTFCAVAALELIGQLDRVNLPSLIKWLARMQGPMEGGFMGRTHKLVDGCYSYWQGAAFSILQPYLSSNQQMWKSFHAPIPNLVIDELEDIRPYASHGECAKVLSHRTRAKEQGEIRLRKRAIELEIDLKEALDHLMLSSQEQTVAPQQLRFQLFRECFDECQEIISATEVSFSSLFPEGSIKRSQLPVYEKHKVDHEVLYDALGLQFWILYHSQTESFGGFRDKPGKRPDLYHTCYCLSGLAAAQQYSGKVLGNVENTLEEVDLVLNILKIKKDAALQYFMNKM